MTECYIIASKPQDGGLPKAANAVHELMLLSIVDAEQYIKHQSNRDTLRIYRCVIQVIKELPDA